MQLMISKSITNKVSVNASSLVAAYFTATFMSKGKFLGTIYADVFLFVIYA